ncbi:hypothetical protein M0R04_08050 [Candidatus Dojkabacteria bacterium]|nr:hypothetical protein [Candidatus Dojkabacteria bacterium]
MIGKDLLVKVAKSFFDQRNIRIASSMEGIDNGLLDELMNYQAKYNDNTNRTSYKAIIGKDDQVSAMMM